MVEELKRLRESLRAMHADREHFLELMDADRLERKAILMALVRIEGYLKTPGFRL